MTLPKNCSLSYCSDNPASVVKQVTHYSTVLTTQIHFPGIHK